MYRDVFFWSWVYRRSTGEDLRWRWSLCSESSSRLAVHLAERSLDVRITKGALGSGGRMVHARIRRGRRRVVTGVDAGALGCRGDSVGNVEGGEASSAQGFLEDLGSQAWWTRVGFVYGRVGEGLGGGISLSRPPPFFRWKLKYLARNHRQSACHRAY